MLSNTNFTQIKIESLELVSTPFAFRTNGVLNSLSHQFLAIFLYLFFVYKYVLSFVRSSFFYFTFLFDWSIQPSLYFVSLFLCIIQKRLSKSNLFHWIFCEMPFLFQKMMLMIIMMIMMMMISEFLQTRKPFDSLKFIINIFQSDILWNFPSFCMYSIMYTVDKHRWKS